MSKAELKKILNGVRDDEWASLDNDMYDRK